VIRNYGKTPAKNVRFVAHGYVGGYWSDTPQHDFSDATIIHMADIPPNDFKERDGYHVHGLREADEDIRPAATSP
jgi:hypothetical protein